jgi:hypothetical protein
VAGAAGNELESKNPNTTYGQTRNHLDDDDVVVVVDAEKRKFEGASEEACIILSPTVCTAYQSPDTGKNIVLVKGTTRRSSALTPRGKDASFFSFLKTKAGMLLVSL